MMSLGIRRIGLLLKYLVEQTSAEITISRSAHGNETAPASKALNFIETCKSETKKILGIDRVFLRDGSFILDLEAIVDFTMTPELPRSMQSDADAACAFIRDKQQLKIAILPSYTTD